MSSNEHKEKIWNLIKDIKVGMLTTHCDDELRSRPMHLVQDNYDDTIWFFTNSLSEKIFEMKHDRDVNLSFSCPKTQTYVSMTGKARLTHDKDLINKFWNPFVAAWFPQGKDAPDVALIAIKISKGEHWDTEKSKILQLFEIAKANLTDKQPDLGENQEFGT